MKNQSTASLFLYMLKVGIFLPRGIIILFLINSTKDYLLLGNLLVFLENVVQKFMRKANENLDMLCM